MAENVEVRTVADEAAQAEEEKTRDKLKEQVLRTVTNFQNSLQSKQFRINRMRTTGDHVMALYNVFTDMCDALRQYHECFLKDPHLLTLEQDFHSFMMHFATHVEKQFSYIK